MDYAVREIYGITRFALTGTACGVRFDNLTTQHSLAIRFPGNEVIVFYVFLDAPVRVYYNRNNSRPRQADRPV